VRIPDDPALPRLGVLLGPEAMAPVLDRSLGRHARVGAIRIARIAYKPGVRAVVHYEVTVDGRTENAVAFAQARSDLAARARRPDLLALARRVDGRSPAADPVAYDADADALLTWLPLDPALPALAEPPARLAERLARAGLDRPDVEPAIVPESYKPGGRIVLRLGRHVLKAYGAERGYERGVTGLRLAASMPLRTARAEACFADLRLTVQSAVDGSAPKPEAAAATAGALVRRLQAASMSPPSSAGSELFMALAAEKAALTARILPELAPRLTRLLERLQETLPRPGELLPAHGDFDADQLLEVGDGEPVVIDFDDVCLAPAALDLATYLADVVRGRDGDRDALEAIREALFTGYGAPPPALDWHLAAVVVARSAHPFQRAVRGWAERAESMLRTAEEALAQ
jgi:Phosphotransferase enzyme family